MADLGFWTQQAEDGQIALDMCQEMMPDAILLDWNMPVMDGMQFLLALRKVEGGDRPKVVFCTTQNTFDHILKAKNAGADAYMFKPFDREIVEAKLQEVGLI